MVFTAPWLPLWWLNLSPWPITKTLERMNPRRLQLQPLDLQRQQVLGERPEAIPGAGWFWNGCSPRPGETAEGRERVNIAEVFG